MGEWRQSEWRKSHRRGVTSEHMLGVGPNARALFWTLFTCAWWDEESPEGRLLDSADPTDAKSIEKLGAMSDLTPGQARAALEKLRRTGTVAVDDHGVVILPRFRKWQRGESFERVKRHRDDRFRNGGGNGDATPAETDNADVRRQTSEQPPPAPPKRRGAGKRVTASVDPRVPLVYDRLDTHRLRHNMPRLSEDQRIPNTIAARLREGKSIETVLAVADAFGRLADRDPSKRTLLNATTPFTGPSNDGSRAGGFAWGLSMLEEQGPVKTAGQRSLLSAAEIMAREAEEDARVTR